jgi:hypothetical protein
MAPNIGDSIKSAVEGAVDRVQDVAENIVDKVKGHSDDSPDETTTVDAADAPTTPEPVHVVAETEAISEPLEFERTDTDGTSKTLTFEPASDTTTTDRPSTTS